MYYFDNSKRALAGIVVWARATEKYLGQPDAISKKWAFDPTDALKIVSPRDPLLSTELCEIVVVDAHRFT